MAVGCLVGNHALRLGRERRRYDRTAFFDDARLFPCDFRERVAEQLHVIHRDAGDDRAERLCDDVGRVKPPAQPDLEHDDVAFLAAEDLKADRGDQLKLGRLVFHPVGVGAHGFGRACQHVVGHGLTVDGNALIESADIGGGEAAHTIACRMQDRREIRHGRTFAVRARDVDDAQIPLRVAHRIAECLNARQSRYAPAPGNRMNVV